ncbi:MAG: DNA polymerase III subunit alpha [Treponema sp.]|nr:DNA polymerase III subunit alpha [Treponema sp.]
MELSTYECQEGTPKSKYIPLDVMSDYSMGESIARIPDLVKKAKALNMKSLALTDRSLSGVIEFYLLCKHNNIKPIIGQKIALKNNEVNLLCKDLDAYKILCKYSLEFQKANNCPGTLTELQISKDEASHFICTTLCADSKLQDLFGQNFYRQIDFSVLKAQPDAIEKVDSSKCIITNPVRFIEKEDYDALWAMKLYLNHSDEKSPEHYFIDDSEILPFLEKINGLELLENLNHLEEEISFIFPEDYFTTSQAHKRISESLPDFDDSEETFRKLAYDEFEKRKSEFKDINKAKARLEYEVNDIISHKWEKIFLLHQELVSWGAQNGIEHGPGRGNAPGSLVSYLLGITDINPLDYGLLYQRFVNPNRLCYPDFDIDYDYDRLGEIVDHLKEKYGNENLLRIITFSRLKNWQAFEIAGKYLNYSDKEIKQIAKIIQNINNGYYPQVSLSKLLDSNSNIYDSVSQKDAPKVQEFVSDKRNKKLITIVQALENIKKNTGLHASGYIVTKSPSCQFVPVLKDEKSGFLYSEYTFDILEYAGLYKNDLLGLKQLTKLKQISDEIAKNTKSDFDYKSIPLDDKSTIQAFAKGKTSDIFQFESSGMKKTLKLFKPESLSDLVLLNALYRPGTMDYLPIVIDNKKSGNLENPFQCDNLLDESYGILVYQEQIMQIVEKIAGYTLGEADMLRRVFGKKRIEDLLFNKKDFIERAVKKGIVTGSQASEIFDILLAFAGNAFNKSHALAYTLIAYWEMYMKVHYPREYKRGDKDNR